MAPVNIMSERNSTLERIQSAGRWLQVFALLLMLLTPTSFAYAWMSQGPLALVTIPAGIAVDAGNLTPLALVVVTILAAFVPALHLLALYFLYRLFRLYAQGAVFSAANVAAIRAMGYVLIAIDPLRILVKILTGPVLSRFAVTEGYLNLELCLSMSIVGIFVLLISYVMELGRSLKENDDLVI